MRDEAKFLSELHSALAHLDDPPYLENHPLASRLRSVAETPELSRGQALRRALRLAIAALDPGAGTTGGLEARSYQVLYRWAVAKQGMVAIAASLGISRRQAYRELRHATEALAQVLGGAVMGAGQETSATLAAQVHDEFKRLSRFAAQDVDLNSLLAGAVQSADCLARQRGLEILLQLETPGLHTTANRVMLRQAILNLLSHIVSVHQDGPIGVHLSRSGRSATVQLSYRPQATLDHPQPKGPYEVATQILQSLDIAWTRDTAEDGTARIRIYIPLTQDRTVLIVEDNEGVIALFRRYLQHQPYRVQGATSAEQALDLMHQLQPDVVILDVMMPDRDGWEVLQMLRATPPGARARFIVCSIINDPKLAIALGAHAFLNKPVDRASLLQVLAEVLDST